MIGEVVVGAGALLDREQTVCDLHAPRLARRALTARLHREEAAQLAGHARHVGLVVVHRESGGAEPRAASFHVLVGERGVELVRR